MEAARFVFSFILFAYNVTYTTRKNHRTVYTARNTDILSLIYMTNLFEIYPGGQRLFLGRQPRKQRNTRFFVF